MLTPIIKSLDSIILNLTEAVKAAIYWDNYIRENEIDIQEFFTRKSSVMINVVDYLVDITSQQSVDNKPEPKPVESSTNSQLVSFYQWKEEKQSCEVIKIFMNLLKTLSSIDEESSVRVEIQDSPMETAVIYNAPPRYKFVEIPNKKEFSVILEPVPIFRSSVEIIKIDNRKFLATFEDQGLTSSSSSQIEIIVAPEAEPEKSEDTISIPDSLSSKLKFEIEQIKSRDKIDEGTKEETNFSGAEIESIEFFDAVDFINEKNSHTTQENEEKICDEIIANLQIENGNNIRHALNLLDDLLKESERNREKISLNPKKIKESLHKINEVFVLLEDPETTSSETISYQETKQKCFSDILKLLESVTNLVKAQIKEHKINREISFSNYESALSFVRTEDLKIPNEKLQQEMIETFELLKNYSEKAKKLIMEFKTRPKTNERKEKSFNECQKKYESCDSYFKKVVKCNDFLENYKEE